MAFTSGSSISSCALDVHLLPFRKKTRQTETGISSGRQSKVGKLDQRSQSSTCRPSHSQHRYDNFHKAITNSTSYLKHFVECNTPPQHAVPCGAGSQRSSASKQRVPLPTTPQRQPGAQVLGIGWRRLPRGYVVLPQWQHAESRLPPNLVTMVGAVLRRLIMVGAETSTRARAM